MDLDPKSLVGKTYLGLSGAQFTFTHYDREWLHWTSRLSDGSTIVDKMTPVFFANNRDAWVEVPSPPTERLCDCGRPGTAESSFWEGCKCAVVLCGPCLLNDSAAYDRHNAKHHPRVEPLPDPRNPKVGDWFKWDPKSPTYLDVQEHYRQLAFVVYEVDASVVRYEYKVRGDRFSRGPETFAESVIPAEPPKPVEPAPQSNALVAVSPDGCTGTFARPVGAGDSFCIKAPNAIRACSCLNDDPGHLDPSCPLFVPPSVKPEAVCACLKCDECRSKLFADHTTAGVTLVHNLVSGPRPPLFPEVPPKPVRSWSPQGLVGGRWSW